jgi:spore coat polysaccharide biosynthesis protein SpsF (cytidylyltransferase family)
MRNTIMLNSSPTLVAEAPIWGILVQARMGSTRLPNKMLSEILPGTTLLEWVLQRLLAVFPENKVVLATTTASADDPLKRAAQGLGIGVFRGSEQDVLLRFRDAARSLGWDHLVRVCADNPLLQVDLLPGLISAAIAARADYASWGFRDGLPAIRSHCGLFAEWASLAALDRAAAATDDPFYHEHVTNYLYTHTDLFSTIMMPIPHEDKVRQWRLTVDTVDDLSLCKRVINGIGNQRPPGLDELLVYLEGHPDLMTEMRTNMSAHVK